MSFIIPGPQAHLLRLEDERSGDPSWTTPYGGDSVIATVLGKWAYYRKNSPTAFGMSTSGVTSKESFEAAGKQISKDMGGKPSAQDVAVILGRFNDTATWAYRKDNSDAIVKWFLFGADVSFPDKILEAIHDTFHDTGVVTKKVIDTAADAGKTLVAAAIPPWLKWTLIGVGSLILIGGGAVVIHKIKEAV